MSREPIAFEDIRVGDTVEQRGTLRGITTKARMTVNPKQAEGVLTPWYVESAEGGRLYDGPRYEWFLIDRPKPQLPTEPGSIIEADLLSGERLILRLDYSGVWREMHTKFAPLTELDDVTRWRPVTVEPAGEWVDND